MSDETEKPSVVPVLAVDALAWATGKISDAKLLLRASPDRPQAIFIVWLPDRDSYRQVLSLVAYWSYRGACCLITRTSTPVVARHLEKNGCIRSFKEPGTPTKFRFLGPPEPFERWLAKFTIPTPSPPCKRPS